MIASEKEQIAKILAVHAEINNKSLSAAAIIIMVEALEDLDFNSVYSALKNWNKNNKNFPYPSDIRKLISPEETDEDNSQDVANAIIAAISKYGYTNKENAESYIGSLGWEVVIRMGGWRHLCEVVTHENEGIYRAQIRDYCGTISRKMKRGDLNKMPELTSSDEIKNIINNSFIGIE
jgi:hypothetical protein